MKILTLAALVLVSGAALALRLTVAGAEDSTERAAFARAQVCALCHDNSPRAQAMRDAEGRGIAPFDLWRSTMMANAARDPFWRAVVAAEVAATPAQRIAIEAKCARCHLPMAEVATGRTPPGHAGLAALLDCDCDRSQLAQDGVSCTVCHRIKPDGLGADESFSGGFRTEAEAIAYGPHAELFSFPMVRHSGFRPAAAAHVRNSALCGSCHTLETTTLDAEGRPTGDKLMEQSPYLEWRNSDFSTEREQPARDARSCQSCHAPTSDDDGRAIHTRIAHNPGGRDWPPIDGRSPFGRHLFVGGNTLVPAMLRDHATTLGTAAPAAAFDATIARARGQLEARTATIAITDVARHDDALRIGVTVANLAGHKLPTGFPSRRVWVRLVAKNAAGTVVFRSGAFDDRGRLLDGQGRVHAAELAGGPVLPHYREIDDGREVQVYETVMADAEGEPTYRLLRGARYAKDNRLLPRGWRADHAEAGRTAPAGVDGDADFAGGGDRIDYAFAAPAADGPYAIEATLCYQALGTRFVAEVLAVKAPAIEAFAGIHAAANPKPERLATVKALVRE